MNGYMDKAQATSLYGKQLGILGRGRGSNCLGGKMANFFCRPRGVHAHARVARLRCVYLMRLLLPSPDGHHTCRKSFPTTTFSVHFFIFLIKISP